MLGTHSTILCQTFSQKLRLLLYPERRQDPSNNRPSKHIAGGWFADGASRSTPNRRMHHPWTARVPLAAIAFSGVHSEGRVHELQKLFSGSAAKFGWSPMLTLDSPKKMEAGSKCAAAQDHRPPTLTTDPRYKARSANLEQCVEYFPGSWMKDCRAVDYLPVAHRRFSPTTPGRVTGVGR